MTNNLNYRAVDRNTMLDALTTAIGSSGKLKIYAGSQPATADTALSGQSLLASLACSATFAAGASSGVLTASAISNDSSADNTGTAAWGTITKSDDTRIMDFTVGTSGADMTIDNTSINSGQVVSCSSFVITGGNV